MPKLLEDQVIALSDNPTEFTVHLKDGCTDEVELSKLGAYFENNSDKLEVQKFIPRRRRLPD